MPLHHWRVTTDRPADDLLRRLAPQVLGTLMRRHGDFELCEDAVQEALLVASGQWADEVPDNPHGWLLAVASRRLIDQYRSESARRRREVALVAMQPTDQFLVSGPDALPDVLAFDPPWRHDLWRNHSSAPLV